MTSQTPVETQLSCTQCGGELHPDEGQSFLTCPFCGTAVYLDRARVVFHWYVAPTLDERQAAAALFRWMSGSQTVKDLDRKAKVVGHSFQYFPMWFFKWMDGKQERITLQPAAATSVTELASLKLPAGDLRRYESSLEADCLAPSVPLRTALEWARGGGGAALTPGSQPQAAMPSGEQLVTRETALVHVPVFFFKYEFRGETYTAVVDAASGTVLANLFPAKEEAPYLLVGAAAALVYLFLALIPIGGILMGGDSGAGIGLAICTGAGLLAAGPLFAWAFWVASRI